MQVVHTKCLSLHTLFNNDDDDILFFSSHVFFMKRKTIEMEFFLSMFFTLVNVCVELHKNTAIMYHMHFYPSTN